MIDKLLEWRIYTKLRSTYVDALPTLMAADGRLHTTFHQAVAATGRLSSSDPNLQNIPIRTPLGRRIRRAFVAGGRRPDPRRGRLQPDRAADPRPRVGRRAPARRVRPQRRPPPRDGRARAPQGPGRGDPRRALDGEDGQLRDRLRAERLRAVGAGEHPAGRGAGVHQHLLRDLFGDQLLHARDQGAGADPGLRDDAPRPQAPDPGAGGAQPDAARRRRADGHQHADPGHRRRHRQDRDDPARRAAARRRLPRPAAAPGPRRAAARGPARRGRPARAAPARDDGERPAARRPADRRHQGRRRLGIDDAADPRRRDRRRSRRSPDEAPLAPTLG